MSGDDYICRFCLMASKNLLSLNTPLEESLRIVDYFYVHLNMDICESDGLPQSVCQTCFDKLLEVRKFHLKCLESEKYLQMRLKNVNQLSKELELNEIIHSPHTDSNIDSEFSNYYAVEFLDGSEICDSEEDEDKTKVFDSFVGLQQEKSPILYPITKIEIEADDECGISASEDKIDIFPEIQQIETRKGKKPIYCLQCHQEFTTKNNLRKHFIKMHSTDNEKGLCIQCSKTFASRGILMSHLRTHKHSSASLQCTYCDKLFTVRDKLISHVRTHTGERPFVCTVCQKGFTQKSALTTHMTLHTGKKVPCPLCDKKFSRSSFLKLHLREHNNVRPYACDLCDKRFRQTCHLKSHLLIHSNSKSAACDICGQTFRQKSSLRMHMYKHTRKPYKCPMCSMECKILYIFRKHLIEVHDIHEDPKLYKRKEMDESESVMFI